MGLTLLHISDIHFKTYENEAYDMDNDIQNEIENDLKQLRQTYRNIDITLIGGDIAFSGSEDEYKKADDWIKAICEITGCEQENVLTVPGNHDVQREMVSPVTKDVHASFKSLKDRSMMDRKMEDFMNNQGSAEVLLGPFSNYMAFAQKYGSVPSTKNGLYWEKSFNLDESILRIRGVNSAIVSNEQDDLHKSKMVLTTHQSKIPREAGVINAVLCHHPPQWMYDGDEASDDFDARARLQMFGHKHNFRSDVHNNCLILSAGAMLPSRREAGWEPRYNIIQLSLAKENSKPVLVVRNYRRKWDTRKQHFTADYAEGGLLYHEDKLPLTDLEVSQQQKKTDVKNNGTIENMSEPIINPQVPNPKRKLAYMFLSLPYHSKITIAVNLGLVEESDRHLDEVVREQNYFLRAVERDLLFELWEEVVNESGKEFDNPFTKK